MQLALVDSRRRLFSVCFTLIVAIAAAASIGLVFASVDGRLRTFRVPDFFRRCIGQFII